MTDQTAELIENEFDRYWNLIVCKIDPSRRVQVLEKVLRPGVDYDCQVMAIYALIKLSTKASQTSLESSDLIK